MGASHRLHTRPVFVDGSGRRRRWVLIAGAAIAIALVSGLVVLALGFLGTPAGHAPDLPGADAPGGSSDPVGSFAPAGAQSEEPSPAPQPTQAKQTSATTTVTIAPPGSPRRPTHPPRPTKSR